MIARMKQLEASLERLLGMDFVFAERYVVVNLPAAFAEAISHDKVERRYRVVVGKTDKPSPTLTGAMRHGPARRSAGPSSWLEVASSTPIPRAQLRPTSTRSTFSKWQPWLIRVLAPTRRLSLWK